MPLASLPARPCALRLAVTLALLAALVLTGVAAPNPPAAAQSMTPVLQREQLTAPQIAAWFLSTPARVAAYRASVPVETLAQLFVEEGRAEGIAGDLAFAQAVLETGNFGWPNGGQVRHTYNNFGGLGACDGGTCTVARFPTARIGVRANIHHLRAYADPTVTEHNLTYPLASPRFHLVTPKGRAPNWEDFGGGNWATDPAYATKILNLHAAMRAHAEANGGLGQVGTFADVPRSSQFSSAVETLVQLGVTTGCTHYRFCVGRAVSRAEMATFLVRATPLTASTVARFADVSPANVHAENINGLAASGVAQGCGPERYCPTDTVTRAQLASLLQRSLGLPARSSAYSDVSPDSPHAGAIGALTEAGLLTGFPDGSFRPNEPLTRGQMARVLERLG
jgi:hypothetical protein